jgi:hypothetical protein
MNCDSVGVNVDAQEAADYDAIMSRQSDILRRTAVALRGPEPTLARWSVADLPERAASVVAERDALKAELEQWRKLSDPATLHANLVRGIPCKLPDNLLLHLLGDEWKSIAEMREAIYLTLAENAHLADGDDCTLKRLKDAIR